MFLVNNLSPCKDSLINVYGIVASDYLLDYLQPRHWNYAERVIWLLKMSLNSIRRYTDWKTKLSAVTIRNAHFGKSNFCRVFKIHPKARLSTTKCEVQFILLENPRVQWHGKRQYKKSSSDSLPLAVNLPIVRRRKRKLKNVLDVQYPEPCEQYLMEIIPWIS